MSVVAKATAVIDLVCLAHAPLRLADIAARTGTPLSSTHRLLGDLVALDVLRRNSQGLYLPGARLLSWGTAADAAYGLRAHAAPLMTELAERSRESINLHVIQGDHRVCVSSQTSPDASFNPVQIGQSLPLGLGATGRVLLAFLPDDERTAVIARLTATGRTLPDEVALSRVRAHHWATSSHEQEIGLIAGAAPIVGPGGRILGALAVGGDVDRLSPEALDALRPHVQRAAVKIGSAVTGTPAPPVD